MQLDVERFLALVCRELGAEEAHIRDSNEPTPENSDPCELRWRMPDGRSVVARFALAPADREARQRRLEMLAGTFDTVWDKDPDEARPPRSRPPAARSLREELQALCERAGASNAVVVDANSPVVWGAAHPEGLTEAEGPPPVAVIAPVSLDAPEPVTAVGHASPVVPPAPVSSAAPVGANDLEADSEHDGTRDGGVSPTARAAAASRIAVQVVRTMTDGAASRKGKHVRHVERSGEAPFVAHSFAGIYLLVVVYEALFDELRAERTIVEALPRIERLVLALPPLDTPPTKGAGVVSMRRRS